LDIFVILDNTCEEDLDELKTDLERSGQSSDKLEEIKPKVVQWVSKNTATSSRDRKSGKKNIENLVFSVKYSHDNNTLKKLIRERVPDIRNIWMVFHTTRKHPSICNRVVKNRGLGQPQPVEQSDKKSQK
jgi:hypothetical protein